jgi:hypothetical protein
MVFDLQVCAFDVPDRVAVGEVGEDLDLTERRGFQHGARDALVYAPVDVVSPPDSLAHGHSFPAARAAFKML